MENHESWLLADEEKEKFISALTPELVILRTKAGISQEELASLIGVSRQTYGAIERKARRMSWNTFLSLVMFYDYNRKTHQMIRAIGAFPEEIIRHFNEGTTLEETDLQEIFGEGIRPVADVLDEQALHSIKTLIMVEYARCTNTPGDAVVKSFDGKTFGTINSGSVRAAQAIKAIKERGNKQ